MPGKQEQQRQGTQRDKQNTGTDTDRSNLGEQIPDQSRKGQGSERGSQPTTGTPNREGIERSGSTSGTERDTSTTQRNNPERGSQRS
jgi:hypothetical protein